MQPDTYDDVHRNLGGDRYLIRKRLPLTGWTLRLRLVDLGVVMLPSLLLWNVLSLAGLAKSPMPIIRLPYEPFGLFGLMIVPAVVISILHRVQPHTDVSRAIAAMVSARHYGARPRRADRGWKPGAARSVFARESEGTQWTF